MFNVPSIITATPDYVIGLEKNHMVLVPIGADTTGGRTASETTNILVGTQTQPQGAITVNSLSTFGVFSATGASNKTLTSSGSGNVTVGATGTGTTTITRVNNFTVVNTDTSGTPGNATINGAGGRAAFAAAASTCVITNSNVTAASKVFVSLTGAADSTLKYVTVTPGAGTFTVTGNASATATTVFDFFVVN